MQDEKSMTSMVITIVVALIVIGAVLVPIVGGLSGSGGSGGGGGGGEGGEDTAEQYVYSNYNSINANDISYFLTAEDGRQDNIVYDWDAILFLGSGFSGYCYTESDDVGVSFYLDYAESSGEDETAYIFVVEEFDTSTYDIISEEIYEKVSNATLTVYPDNSARITLTYMMADVETNKTVTFAPQLLDVSSLPTIEGMSESYAYSLGLLWGDNAYVSIGSEICVFNYGTSSKNVLKYNGENQLDTGIPAEGGGNVIATFTQVDSLHWSVGMEGNLADSDNTGFCISNKYYSEEPQIGFDYVNSGSGTLYLTHAGNSTIRVETDGGDSFEVAGPLKAMDSPSGIQIIALGEDWALGMDDGRTLRLVGIEEEETSIIGDFYRLYQGERVVINGNRITIKNSDNTDRAFWLSKSTACYLPSSTGAYIPTMDMSNDTLEYTGTAQYNLSYDTNHTPSITDSVFSIIQGISPTAQVNRQGYIAEKPLILPTPTESGSNEEYAISKMAYGSNAVFDIEVSNEEWEDGMTKMPIVYADNEYLIFNAPFTNGDQVYRAEGRGLTSALGLPMTSGVEISNVSSDGITVTVTYTENGSAESQTFQFAPSSAGYYVSDDGDYGTYANPYMVNEMSGAYDSLYAPSDLSTVPLVTMFGGVLLAGYNDSAYPGMVNTSISEMVRDFTVEDGVVTDFGWKVTYHDINNDQYINTDVKAVLCILPNVIDNESSGGSSSNGGNDLGTAGTIIAIIPVFAILAVLMYAVQYLRKPEF